MWKQTRPFNRAIVDNAGMCHRLVRRGYDIGAGGPKGEPIGSAWAAWEFSKTKHTDRSFPQNVAVPIWFSHYGTYGSPAKYANWGHVVVWYPGVGYISSPGSGRGQKIFSTIGAVESYFKAKFAGWSEDVNGVRVIEKVPLAANQRQVKGDSPTNIRSAPSRGGSITGSYAKNAIITMDGFVRGEDYAGTDIWFKTDKGFSWGGSYTSQSVAGLTDLTPVPEPTAPEPEPLPEPTPEPIPEPEIPVEPELPGELQPTPEEPDPATPDHDSETPTLTYNWATIIIPTILALIVGLMKGENIMSKYANKRFWIDAADRAIATFAQAAIGALGAGVTGILDIDFGQVASVAGLAAVVSLLTSIAFRGKDIDPITPQEYAALRAHNETFRDESN